MLLSAVYVMVVAQSSSEVLEGLTNNPVYDISRLRVNCDLCQVVTARHNSGGLAGVTCNVMSCTNVCVC